MPSAADIVTFLDPPVPPGESPYVDGQGPSTDVRVVEPDPAWPSIAQALIDRIRAALGDRVLSLEHVGSTSVPGLAAKPVIDLDLAVADPDDEDAYVPPLVVAGFVHVVREPWWYGHRLLRGTDPAANLHVYGPDSAESVRQRLFRDWLRQHPEDRDRYALAKIEAASAARAAQEHVQQYNARKERVVRDIYARLFQAAGLRG